MSIKDLPDFTEAENNILCEFTSRCEMLILEVDLDDNEFSFYNILEELHIDVSAYNKESDFMIALWLVYFDVIIKSKKHPPFKYATNNDFLKLYDDFRELASNELYKLIDTSNYMNVLFHLLPPKQNKGLILKVSMQLH